MTAWARVLDALIDDGAAEEEAACAAVTGEPDAAPAVDGVEAIDPVPLAPVVIEVAGALDPDVLTADDAAVCTACWPMKPTSPSVPTLARIPAATVALEMPRRAALRAAMAVPRRGGATRAASVRLERASLFMHLSCLMWVSRSGDLLKDGRRISTGHLASSMPWRVVQLAERRTLDP